MAKAELKTILKHGRIYGLANLLNRGAGLILLPFYAHVLTPAEFGVYAAITLLVDLLSVLLGMGLGRALMRLYIERESQAEKDAVVGTALAAFAVLAGVFALLAHPLAAAGNALLLGNAEHVALTTYAIWALILTTLVTIALNYVLVRKQSLLYLGVSVLKAGLFIGLNLWFVGGLEWGVTGIVLGTLLSSAVVAGVLLTRIAREAQLRFSPAALKDLIVFGGPLVPAVLLDTVLSSLDRYVLGLVHGAAPLGQYGLGLRLATALHLFMTGPFLQIWGVRQLEALEKDPDGRELPDIFFYFTTALIAAALGLSLFADEFVAVIADAAYAEAARLIPFLAALQVIVAVRSYVEAGIFHAKRTAVLPLIGMVSLVLAAPTYWVAARLFGPIGIAAAGCLLALARAGLAAFYADRCTSIVRLFPWGALVAVVALAGITYAGGLHWAAGLPSLQAAGVKTLALVAFVLAAAVPILFVEHAERRQAHRAPVRELSAGQL